MIQRICCIAFLLLFAKASQAQFYYYDDKYMDNDILFDAGLSLGMMVGVTDVGERKSNPISPGYYDFGSAKPNIAFHCTIMYQSIVEGGLSLTFGGVAGKDANSNSSYVRSRNLSYKSGLTEIALTGAFHPIALLDLEYLPVLSPYVIVGFGMFKYNPMTSYDGSWVELRPLHTEAQNSNAYPGRREYGKWAMCYPMGGGLKYELNAKYNLRFEVLYRPTSTDYLDDVSTTYVPQSVYDSEVSYALAHRYKAISPATDRTGKARGNPNIKDRYISFDFKVGYVIGREKRKRGMTR